MAQWYFIHVRKWWICRKNFRFWWQWTVKHRWKQWYWYTYATPYRCVIIIIFQLWQNFSSCNTPCMGTININRKVTKSIELSYRRTRSLHCTVLQFGPLKWSNKKHVLLTSSSTSTWQWRGQNTEACVRQIHFNQDMVGADKKYQLLQICLAGGK